MAHTQPMPPEKQPDPTLLTDELPDLQLTRRRALPTGIATNVKQHVVLVRDHSSSMAGDKIDELNIASQAFVQALAAPENKAGFRLSVVDFNHYATRICSAQSPQACQLPQAVADGGTNFNAALQETLQAILELKQAPNEEGWHYLRPVVLFLSDGQSMIDKTHLYALQEHATIIAIAYGTDANETLLSDIASDGKVHLIGVEGSQLRQFLADVGKTLSQALQHAQ